MELGQSFGQTSHSSERARRGFSCVDHSNRDSSYECSSFTHSRELNFFLQFFQFSMIHTQAVSRCIIIPPWCLYQRSQVLRLKLFEQPFVLLCCELFHDQLILTRNQPTQIFTPTRQCSEDTELISSSDCAKRKLRVRRIRFLKCLVHLEPVLFRIPRFNALTPRNSLGVQFLCSVPPFYQRWSSISLQVCKCAFRRIEE